MEWHIAYDKIRAYVLRIETLDGRGTGFLFAYNKDKSTVAVATASHVVETARNWKQPIKLWHPASKATVFLEARNRSIWLDRAHDAASILVRAEELKLSELPSTVLPLLDASMAKKVGVELGWAGFPALAVNRICFFSGRVSARAEQSYLVDGVAIHGVSGGPVFDNVGKEPRIIGVVSAYMPNLLSGESLPGLLQVRDLKTFHDHIQRIRSFDEAIEKEHEVQSEIKKESPMGTKSEGWGKANPST
jgi:hypothetical protein